jgi:hypothetical protein
MVMEKGAGVTLEFSGKNRMSYGCNDVGKLIGHILVSD